MDNIGLDCRFEANPPSAHVTQQEVCVCDCVCVWLGLGLGLCAVCARKLDLRFIVHCREGDDAVGNCAYYFVVDIHEAKFNPHL